MPRHSLGQRALQVKSIAQVGADTFLTIHVQALGGASTMTPSDEATQILLDNRPSLTVVRPEIFDVYAQITSYSSLTASRQGCRPAGTLAHRKPYAVRQTLAAMAPVARRDKAKPGSRTGLDHCPRNGTSVS